jgi:hypothetical protein
MFFWLVSSSQVGGNGGGHVETVPKSTVGV